MLKGLVVGCGVAVALSMGCSGDHATFPHSSKPLGASDGGGTTANGSDVPSSSDVTNSAASETTESTDLGSDATEVGADDSSSAVTAASSGPAPSATVGTVDTSVAPIGTAPMGTGPTEPDDTSTASSDDTSEIGPPVATTDEPDVTDETEMGPPTDTTDGTTATEPSTDEEPTTPPEETEPSEATETAEATEPDATEPPEDTEPAPAECGDGIVQDGEECDDDNHVNTDGCKQCEVMPGWECYEEPSECANLDECEEELDDCNDHAECTNLTTGTFTCECSPGYTGNGVNCTDVDECALNQDDCNDIKGLCLNDTPGSFSCACVLPYYGDGKSCDCQQKAATNVMGQAGFDAQSSITDDGSATSFAGGFGSLVEWDSQQDADGCPDSGSVMFGSAASGVDSVPYGVSGVCAPVAPDTDYHFGFKFKLNAGAGFGCQLLEYDTSDCGTFVTAANSRHYSAPSVDDTLWRQSEDLALHTEDNVHGVLVYCQADSNQTETNYVYSHIDHFYLNSAAAKF